MEPPDDPNLKNARFLTQVSFAFLILGIVALLCQKNFSRVSTAEYSPAQVMAVIAFTATVVLGCWTFIHLLKAPPPIPQAYQIGIGFFYGNSAWVVLGLMLIPFGSRRTSYVIFLTVIVALLFSSFLALVTTERIGKPLISGIVAGIFLPILALGVCGML